jgi:hypothetical protein
VELDAADGAERPLGGEQQRTALATAEVDEGVVLDGEASKRLTPTLHCAAEQGGGGGVVALVEVVVGVAGGEIGGVEKAFGVDLVAEIEGMEAGRLGAAEESGEPGGNGREAGKRG